MLVSPEVTGGSGSVGSERLADVDPAAVDLGGAFDPDALLDPPTIPVEVFGPGDTPTLIPEGGGELVGEHPVFKAEVEEGLSTRDEWAEGERDGWAEGGHHNREVTVTRYIGIKNGKPFFMAETDTGLKMPVAGDRLINPEDHSTFFQPDQIDTMRHSLGMEVAITQALQVLGTADFANPNEFSPEVVSRVYTALRANFVGLRGDVEAFGPDGLRDGDPARMVQAAQLLERLMHRVVDRNPAYSHLMPEPRFELVRNEQDHIEALVEQHRDRIAEEQAAAETHRRRVDQTRTPANVEAVNAMIDGRNILRVKENIREWVHARVNELAAERGERLTEAERNTIAEERLADVIEEMIATIPKSSTADSSTSALDGYRLTLRQKLETPDAQLVQQIRKSDAHRRRHEAEHRVETRRHGRHRRRVATDMRRYPRVVATDRPRGVYVAGQRLGSIAPHVERVLAPERPPGRVGRVARAVGDYLAGYIRSWTETEFEDGDDDHGHH